MDAIIETINVTFAHRVHFTRDAFSTSNGLLRELFRAENPSEDPRALVLVDDCVGRHHPQLTSGIRACFAQAGMPRLTEVLLLPGGEAAKASWKHISTMHAAIERNRIDRHSYVLAIGGGAFLDVAGLAATTAHRGVRHVRFPTTVMGQCDSGVGVKNGVNLFGKKNFAGTFCPPFAVINDFAFLDTLPPRELRSGFSEAVKVACIRSAPFFASLEEDAPALAGGAHEAVERLIKRSAELHVRHIAQGGDPFETGSSRPLDFGHWAAHKLEQLSGFTLRHGEAVAIGLAVDVTYSKRAGYLATEAADRILALLRRLGFSLYSDRLSTPAGSGLRILEGLDEFREHLGGTLCITLLRDIGEAFETSHIDAACVAEAIAELAEKASSS